MCRAAPSSQSSGLSLPLIKMRTLILAWTFVAARADTCDNTCIYANDGDCDDGQPGSDYSYCACGTDCSDCGSRASCDVAAGAANTCPGQTTACEAGYPCAAGEFCNFDYGSYGFCEQCSSFSDSAFCSTSGLPSAGEADCEACCFRNYWAVGNGWCSSDLDDYVGDTSDASACWTMCENTYGSDLVAIDWTPDGECWCQDDCQCMEDTEDDDIHLITRSDVAALPNTCVSACPAEEAAFENCLGWQGRLDDDYFVRDGGYFLATGGQSCDAACASAGGCDLAAITAAAASLEACKSIIDDLGASYGPSGCCGNPGDSTGCSYHPGQSGWAQVLGNPTCGTVDPDVERQRVCACNSYDDDDDDDFAPNTCADVQEWLSTGECADGPAVCRAEYDAWVECHYEDMAREELGQACDFTCSPDKKSNRDNVGLLILIIVCSVAGCLCLLAISTAIIYTFGGCFCFAKHKKKRVAEPSSSAPSAPVPLAVAQYVTEPPPMSPGTLAKTQEHIRRTAALMAEAPPSPGPPPLAPIKATETLAPEMP